MFNAGRKNIVDLKDNFTYHAIMADQGRIFRKVLESIAAVSALLLGLMFVSSGYSSPRDIYLPLSLIAPAWAWGTLMLMLGAIRVVVIVVNGWWPYSHRARKYLSGMFIFGIWLPLGACFWWYFVGDVLGDELRTYPGLAYSTFTLGAEFLIYYAHASFVYAIKRGQDG